MCIINLKQNVNHQTSTFLKLNFIKPPHSQTFTSCFMLPARELYYVVRNTFYFYNFVSQSLHFKS